MEQNDMKQKLMAVCATLDTIEIKGVSNMSKVIGCTQILQEILNNIDDKKETQ